MVKGIFEIVSDKSDKNDTLRVREWKRGLDRIMCSTRLVWSQCRRQVSARLDCFQKHSNEYDLS